MENKVRKAKVVKTGETVKVYALKSGGYGNYEDGGKTIYQQAELEFLKD